MLGIISVNLIPPSYVNLIIVTLRVLVKKISEQVAAGYDGWARVKQRIPGAH